MRTTVEIAFHSESAAFDENPSAECARIIRDIALDIEDSADYCEGNCRDINGNTVGSFSFTVRTAPDE
jgi:hypothetical protein